MSGSTGALNIAPPAALTTVAEAVFGAALPQAERYAGLLAEVATIRGLIGPRELPRLWDRHLLNCAVIAELVPAQASVVDVGSGAGLPGLPLAIVRPDLRITLLDSLLRRSIFLHEMVAALDLADRVQVVRARAEEHRTRYDVVTARALGPLAVVGRWSAPLCRPGGLLVAIRGEHAAAELASDRALLTDAGWQDPQVTQCGAALPVPTTVIRATRTGAAR
ncbi:MAG TPA: 16S rRNA (guanine(527)-N(7))-methyltransferase RsmG [Mycobacteriales bacterium]|nr:16S rRNA (guanine(527)-N(7))-methyltransferase RsmG [Mycobacteriales bacterium]